MQPGKRLGPEPGICDKLGTVFFTLIITLLRIAEFFIIPEWSPITWVVICLVKCAGATAAATVANLYSTLEDLYYWVIQYIWIPILQVVLRVTPMLCVRGFLWWINMIFNGVAWVLWWTRYLASRWKYLSVSGRSIRDIACDPASKLPKCEQRFVRVDGILRDIWLSRSLQEKQIN